MKLQVPEYLLCEDPASETENLFIYHVPTRSLIHIIHTDNLSKKETDEILLNRGKYFEYTYRNTVGNIEKIMFVAEIIGSDHPDEQTILAQSAHWYACYLGWEEECADIIK